MQNQPHDDPPSQSVVRRPRSCNKCCTSAGHFWSQYIAMVIKNFRLTIRNWPGTVGLLISPLLVVLFLLAMQGVANLILKNTDPYPKGRQIEPIIPKCVPAATPECYTIAYAPQGTGWVRTLMQQLANTNGLNFETDFLGIGQPGGPSSETDFFADNSTMYNYFVQNQNKTQLGIIFTSPYMDRNNNGAHIPNDIGYWIFHNQTYVDILDTSMLAIEREIGNSFYRRGRMTAKANATTSSYIDSVNLLSYQNETQYETLDRLWKDFMVKENLARKNNQQTGFQMNYDESPLTYLLLRLAYDGELSGNFHRDTSDFSVGILNTSRLVSELLETDFFCNVQNPETSTFPHADKVNNYEKNSNIFASLFNFSVQFKTFPVAPARFSEISLENSQGGTLYFIPPMIIFFVLLTEIVQEKEAKLRVGMKMMGLSTAAYWLSWYTHGALWVIVITGLQYAAGYASGYTFFTNSNPFSVIALLVTFGIAMMTVAFFLTTVISSTKTAQTIGYAIILIGFVFQGVLNSVNGILVDMLWVKNPVTMKDKEAWITAIRYILSMYPPFSLAKVWADISVLSTSLPDVSDGLIKKGPGFKWDDMYQSRPIFNTTDIFVESPPPADSFYTLIINMLVFGLIAWYLDKVLPGEHGTPLPFYFLFTREYWGYRTKRPPPDLRIGRASHINNGDYDTDVEKEHDAAFEATQFDLQSPYSPSRLWLGYSPFRTALRLLNIKKLYRRWMCCKSDTDTAAVDNVSLSIADGELFTLLGHNGAGKTTLISMLTGLIKPTNGRAYVYGYDLEDELDEVQSLIGVCPQHDVLWPELTAKEHLYLFARIKGIPRYLLDREVHEKLKLVGLEKVADKPAGGFSGGMKRRLSVAVSCIGDPKLVFLDEPSSGLDPVNKRKIWKMIQGLKKQKAVVLTTHSMEEAEVLSDRLAIMAFGKIRAIGDSLHLKNKYGDGYRISMVVDEAALDTQQSLPTARPEDVLDNGKELRHRLKSQGKTKAKIGKTLFAELNTKWPFLHLISNDSGMLLLGCPRTYQDQIPAVLEVVMNDARVSEWGLSHSTLESVFLAVTRHHNFVYEQIEDDSPALTTSSSEEEDSEEGEDFPATTDSSRRPPANTEPSYNTKFDEVDDNFVQLDQSEDETAYLDGRTVIDSKSPSNKNGSTKPSLSSAENGKSATKTLDWKIGSSSPMRAVFAKNLTIQWRQRFSTACQITAPLLIILVMVILKVVIKSQLGPLANPILMPGMPIAFNPAAAFRNTANGLNGMMYMAFTDKESKISAGNLPNYPSGSGMIGSIPQYYSCCLGERFNYVPWLYPFDSEKDIQDGLYRNLSKWNAIPSDDIDKYPRSMDLPDAYANFHEINPEQFLLRTTIAVNDHPVRVYHRQNNLTRLEHKLPGKWLKNPGSRLSSDLIIDQGRLQWMSMLLRSFYQWLLRAYYNIYTQPSKSYGNLVISQPMPQIVSDNAWAFLELAGTLLYPLGLSLQIPLYLFMLSVDKSEKLREMMLSHGLKTRYYHLSNYIFFYLIYFVAASLFWISGIAYGSRFFTDTHWSVLFLFFSGWGFSLVSVSCFISSFINSPRVATVAGYIIALFGSNLAFVVCVGIYGPAEFAVKSPFPFWTFIWPQFSFSRGMYLLNDACALKRECYPAIWHLSWSNEFSKALLGLYLAAIVYFVIFLYLDAVLPRQFGIPKHPFFFILCCFQRCKRKSHKSQGDDLDQSLFRDAVTSSSGDEAPPGSGRVGGGYGAPPVGSFKARGLPDHSGKFVPIAHNENQPLLDKDSHVVQFNDDPFASPLSFGRGNSDVHNEKYIIKNGYHSERSPLVIHGLRKVYDSTSKTEPNGKIAVDGLWLTVDENECFGLLGENGAGKSTTISILTGIISPSSGFAYVGGHDIRTQMDKVHLSMGLCPQFDILWNDLTVKEHLLFYARLKGIPWKHEGEHVDQLIRDVGLTNAANKRTDALSGGMRRRLSIAIALVGDSKIVFLDEPTTGLDAASRRQVWAIIQRAKRGRAIILTTHSMDEAELLCNRIGILAHGKLRCIGNQQHLKSSFGQGVRLKINFETTAISNYSTISDPKTHIPFYVPGPSSPPSSIDPRTASAASFASSVSSIDVVPSPLNVPGIDSKASSEQGSYRAFEPDQISDFAKRMSNITRDSVKRFIATKFPSAVLVGDYSGTQEFHLDKSTNVSKIFRIMESESSQYGITDWAVSQIGLEDVFQAVVAEADKERALLNPDRDESPSDSDLPPSHSVTASFRMIDSDEYA